MKSKIKPSLLFILSSIFFVSACATDVNAENKREISGPVFKRNEYGDVYFGWAKSLDAEYFNNYQGFDEWKKLDYANTSIGSSGEYDTDKFVGWTRNTKE